MPFHQIYFNFYDFNQYPHFSGPHTRQAQQPRISVPDLQQDIQITGNTWSCLSFIARIKHPFIRVNSFLATLNLLQVLLQDFFIGFYFLLPSPPPLFVSKSFNQEARKDVARCLISHQHIRFCFSILRDGASGSFPGPHLLLYLIPDLSVRFLSGIFSPNRDDF